MYARLLQLNAEKFGCNSGAYLTKAVQIGQSIAEYGSAPCRFAPFFRDILSKCETIYGAFARQTLETCEILIEITDEDPERVGKEQFLRNPEEILRLRRQIAHACKVLYGPSHIETARALRELSCCLSWDQKWPDALEVINQALAAYGVICGCDDNDLADLDALEKLGCHQEIYELTCCSMLRETVLLQLRHRLRDSCNRFALQNRFEEALTMCDEALSTAFRYPWQNQLTLGYCRRKRIWVLKKREEAKIGGQNTQRANNAPLRSNRRLRIPRGSLSHSFGNGTVRGRKRR